MSRQSPDLVILGGGCAGLSLAYRLARHQDAPRTLIVDPRNDYTNDRTWCGWPVTAHPFQEDVRARWHDLTLHTDRASTTIESRRYPYEMLEAERFYSRTLAAVEAHPSIERIQAHAVDVEDREDGVTVTLDSGETVRARFGVDTRPHPKPLTSPWLWQDFAGINVQADNLPRHAELMDFRVNDDPQAGIDFLYVLPYAPDQALFEWTRFGRPPTDPGTLEHRLEDYLETRLGPGKWQALRRETGTLPMAPPTRTNGRSMVVTGAYGGAMRAATGYAFHAIQRWADECADALLKGQPPVGARPGRVLPHLDRIFMSTLARHPERAPEFYRGLFEHAPTDSLIRFLSGVPSVRDTLSVMNALPWAPLIGSTLRHALPGQT
ncbi:lycopene beta-cyclase [Kushneria avicenniae]|uniref:Lycopene beta-cyclase n=1 Tax=Kushneria avicenniae TaxID=402385 RepID=A0A1I1MGJ2_9GAMM|nr:lycopene cyclase family protein [Kushneria avicenniae]SFC81783.1 lycopene beta-cyclase [Kushneria avicenniae]